MSKRARESSVEPGMSVSLCCRNSSWTPVKVMWKAKVVQTSAAIGCECECECGGGGGCVYICVCVQAQHQAFIAYVDTKFHSHAHPHITM